MSEGTDRPDERVAFTASKREPLPGARRIGDVDPDTEIPLTIVVRRKPGGSLPSDVAGLGSRAEAGQRLAAAAGADPEDLAVVERYLGEHGIEVVSSDAARRVIDVRTTAAKAAAAFAAELGRYEAGDVSYRGREGELKLPADVAERVEAILGLDDRPQARIHLKRGAPLTEDELPDVDAASVPAALQAGISPVVAAAGAPEPQPLWPAQVAKLYSFPSGVNGNGATIAIIELGGGYRDDELATYFAKVGVPAPSVVAVSVDDGGNMPGGAADDEVLLDIEVCGAIAPGAKIVVYFSDPSDRGFYDALSTAIHDAEHSPSIISISWGAPEDRWTAQARKVFDDTLADAAALGVTVFTAAGDHGAGDAADDGSAHADFPASSPHIVACGGTTLVGVDSETVSEVVWNDGDGWATGGGISDAFAVPRWQAVSMPDNLNRTGRPGRGVPDIAGNADLASGYIVLVNGHYRPIGGTSAVAPLYAGLAALLHEALESPLGDLLPKLYGIPRETSATVFRDITEGDNSVPASEFGPATPGYEAGEGWDACTGLGSVHGDGLLAQLRADVGLLSAPA